MPDTPPAVEAKHSVDFTPEELAFLRLLLTNAHLQPAQAKRTCGDIQDRIEQIIGPMPAPGQ